MQNVVIRAIERLDFRTKEAYKTLRTNLSFAGKNVKVISLTSCTPNEGKTSVSFQLCLSLAESGKQTILVDADLRKSVLRGRYKANREKYGLSHYLSVVFARTQLLERSGLSFVSLEEHGEQGLLGIAAQVKLSLGHGAHGVEEFVIGRTLGDVPVGTECHGFADVGIALMHAEHDDPDARADAPGFCDAFQATHSRHGDI